MGLTYFKRYRMEADLARLTIALPPLPSGYTLRPWDESLLALHADTKYRCFRYEMDAYVFPSLGQRDGCLRLMTEIARGDGFLQSATWLVEYRQSAWCGPEFCGTIQGIRSRSGLGAIQNVGVVPEHRGLGLGTHLLHRALRGFWEEGLHRATLEVTARNLAAQRLYQRVGFRSVRTVYKSADVAFA